MRTIEVYFSATDNTKVSVHEMAVTIAQEETEVIDVTSGLDSLANKTFDADDVVVVGMPVYGGRCPKIAMERLTGIRGNQTPCIVAVTYGNRDYDDALLELCDFMKGQGFLVKGAAALIGKHTFGEIQVTRPDEADLKACRTFAMKAIDNDNEEIVVKGNRPYKDGGDGAKFKPSTTDACVQCGLCVRKCSAHAIDADCKTISDTCISCFRCIKVCPMGAKQMKSEAYDEFAVSFTVRLSKRLENEFFL